MHYLSCITLHCAYGRFLLGFSYFRLCGTIFPISVRYYLSTNASRIYQKSLFFTKVYVRYGVRPTDVIIPRNIPDTKLGILLQNDQIQTDNKSLLVRIDNCPDDNDCYGTCSHFFMLHMVPADEVIDFCLTSRFSCVFFYFLLLIVKQSSVSGECSTIQDSVINIIQHILLTPVTYII